MGVHVHVAWCAFCILLSVVSVPKSGTGVGSDKSPSASAVVPKSKGTSKNMSSCIVYISLF